MKVKVLIALTALTMVSACNKAEAPKADETAATTTAPADAAATTSTAAVDTGVPECDAYLTKVMACIKDKVPEAQRKAMEDGIAQSKSSWAAVTDKSQLAATCKAAMDQAKASYGAMGCSF